MSLQAVTPPNATQAPTCPSSMPTAAAVAAAAVTAKITAMDAVSNGEEKIILTCVTSQDVY